MAKRARVRWENGGNCCGMRLTRDLVRWEMGLLCGVEGTMMGTTLGGWATLGDVSTLGGGHTLGGGSNIGGGVRLGMESTLGG